MELMKPLVSHAIAALALALPLACIPLLPCEQSQDNLSFGPSNTANTSNSTSPTSSPPSACSLSPSHVWAALQALFVPGAVTSP